MTITHEGKVGIGAPDPNSLLHVAIPGGTNQNAYTTGIVISRDDVRMILGSAGDGNNSGTIQVFSGILPDTSSSPAATTSNLRYNLCLQPLGGQVGIRNSAPAHALDVVGSINFTNKLYHNGNEVQFNTGQSIVWSTSGTNAYYSNGKVGIGTTSPLQKLQVNGSILFGDGANTGHSQSGSWAIGLGAAGGGIATDGFTGMRIVSHRNDGNDYTSIGGYSQNIEFYTHHNFGGNSNYYTRMTIAYNGNIGIGTTTPSATLDISGTLTKPRLVVEGMNSALGSGAGTDTETAVLLKNGDTAKGFGNEGQIAFSYKNTTGYEGWKHFIHTRHNNIHTGNNTEEEKNMNAIDFLLSNGTQGNTLTTGSRHIMTIAYRGVGIGTTNPSKALEVHAKTKATIRISSEEDATVSAWKRNDEYGRIEFGGAKGYLTDLGNGTGNGNWSSGGYRQYPVAIVALNDSPEASYVDNNLINRVSGKLEFKTMSYESDGFSDGLGDDGAAEALVTRMTIGGTGNIGIGVTEPKKRLDIYTKNNGGSAGNVDDIRLQVHTGTTNSYHGLQWYQKNHSFEMGAIRMNVGSGYNMCNISFWTSSYRNTPTEKMRIDGSGNVGIGTNSPSYPLDIFRNGGNTIQITSNTDYSQLILRSAAAPGVSGVSSSPEGIWGDCWINYNNALHYSSSGTGTVMTIISNGNVGIGTTSPKALLDISGHGVEGNLRNSIRMNTLGGNSFVRMGRGGTLNDESFSISKNIKRTTGFYRDDSKTGVQALNFIPDGSLSISTDPSGEGIISTNERLYIKYNGNVGVGTNKPESKLHLHSGAVVDDDHEDGFYLRISSKLHTGEWLGLGFQGYHEVVPAEGGGNEIGLGVIKSGIIHQRKQGHGRGTLHFCNNKDDDMTDVSLSDSRMVIDMSGNVGIGITDPVEKLDISGVLHLRGGQVSNRGSDSGFVGSNDSEHLDEYTQTYIRFDQAGSTNDWAYLRQIGVNNGIHLALDFHDDSDDARFSIRNVYSDINHDVSTRFTVLNDKVGIGTDDPQAQLHIHGANADDDHENGFYLRISSKLGTNDWLGLGFQGYHDTNGSVIKSGIIHQRKEGHGRGTLHFCNNDDGNMTDVSLSDSRMVIDMSGNVGIGITDPVEKLDISGVLHLRGGLVSNRGSNSHGVGSNDSQYLDEYKQTYIRFDQAGSTNDWAYLRQIGGNNEENEGEIHLALDFHDDIDDTRFSIRSIVSSQAGHKEYTRFTVLNNEVGIGTDDPQAELDVKATQKTTGTAATLRETAGINFSTDNGINSWSVGYIGGYIAAGPDNDTNKYPGGLLFRTRRQHPDNQPIHAWTNGDVRMVIDASGNVGIGTTKPKYLLHIIGGKTETDFTARYYNSSGANANTTANRELSAYFTNHIACEELQVFSDERIKENIADINDTYSLKKLRDISCVFYNYKDRVGRGNNKTIGFLAQQVNAHLPEAVSLIRDIIPNELRVIKTPSWTTITDSSGNNKYKLRIEDLSNNIGNTLYRFYVSNESSGNREYEKEIKSLIDEPKSFIFEEKWNNVFLYGREVDDFHILDKQKLFALNFSATQEIDKQQQLDKEKIATLEQENNVLKSKVETLETTLQSVLARLSALEAQ